MYQMSTQKSLKKLSPKYTVITIHPRVASLQRLNEKIKMFEVHFFYVNDLH